MENDKSRVLTAAIRGGRDQFVAAGLAVRTDPAGPADGKLEPFKLLNSTGKSLYLGSAQVGDAKGGFGSVTVSVDNHGSMAGARRSNGPRKQAPSSPVARTGR
ncbi:hypothetical protein [Kibdelosporangium phytohabitans]|uniref:Uncharacterized protein n=1 Tax=Kibdelosporangium phytohabitans TaxID=860235 RepID=A0A0N9HT83_9PSEU|nr:hypothetical protein [Kibdelosporangium phytohabitans]ALG06563.1 hypothetical protein AOZ06_06145 [Kibdelosporangium phytohabitans]